MIRNRLFGALRTVLEYIVFVMGGTAILAMFARGLGILWSFNPEFVHPGFRAAFVSGFLYFYALLVYVPRVVVWGLVVPQILSWVFVAVLLYVAALLLARTSSPTLGARIVLAVISLLCSGRVILFFSPALIHDMGSIFFTMFFAGLSPRVFRTCVLDFPWENAGARMGSVTTRKRRLLWFFAIYGLSLSAFALLVMLTRVLLRWTF